MLAQGLAVPTRLRNSIPFAQRLASPTHLRNSSMLAQGLASPIQLCNSSILAQTLALPNNSVLLAQFHSFCAIIRANFCSSFYPCASRSELKPGRSMFGNEKLSTYI